MNSKRNKTNGRKRSVWERYWWEGEHRQVAEGMVREHGVVSRGLWRMCHLEKVGILCALLSLKESITVQLPKTESPKQRARACYEGTERGLWPPLFGIICTRVHVCSWCVICFLCLGNRELSPVFWKKPICLWAWCWSCSLLQVRHTERHVPLSVHVSVCVCWQMWGRPVSVCVCKSFFELCVIMLMAQLTFGFLCGVIKCCVYILCKDRRVQFLLLYAGTTFAICAVLNTASIRPLGPCQLRLILRGPTVIWQISHTSA